MLRRQKLLLAILQASRRALPPIELVKLAFLLRHESEVGGDASYYDFVPYRFGPFSFALYRELEGLQKNGYLDMTDVQIKLSTRLRSEIADKVDQLTSREKSAVRAIISRFGAMSSQSLLTTVYSRYPWFTINSELLDLIPRDKPSRPTADTAIYTSGYEGRSIDQFYNNLLRTGVRTLVDVRFNPVSRKYGFAGSSLKRIGSKLGIEYVHLPSLGIAGEHRASLDDFDSYQRLLDQYAKDFLPKQPAAVTQLADIIRRAPSVLVCMESDVNCCHRGRLATAMAKRTELPVVHL